MSPDPPATKIAKSSSNTVSGGILPVPATSAAKSRTQGPHGISSRHPAPGLKVCIRRLPPGLTDEEFQNAIGDDWKVGRPNVDWYYYAPGKVPKDPTKTSRPSRAYLHLTDLYVKGHAAEPLKELQMRIGSTNFHDAKGTHTDSVLATPWPTVMTSPYSRTPSTKIRKDNRQGTIDQDVDFIDFLQELTNPIVKPVPIDALADKENSPEEKIVTPLVQYLREKKANKGKESSSSGKSSKASRQEVKDSKAVTTTERKSGGKGAKDGGADKKTSSKVEKSNKEPMKVLTKPVSQSTNVKPEKGAAMATKQTAPTESAAPTKPERRRERERGSAAAAAKILQRDLGIAAGANNRKRRDASNAATGTKSIGLPNQVKEGGRSTQNASASNAATSGPKPAPNISVKTTEHTSTENNAKAGTNLAEPGQNTSRSLSKSSTQATKGSSAAQKATPKSVAPAVTPTATEAFLKHANPSQGITEDLLQATFAGFGVVTKVEIDKRKGFAYIDFAEPEALRKAIAASPVKIAQAAVVVLERKATTPATNRAGRGESRVGRGGSSSRGGHGRGRGRGTGDASSGAQATATTSQVSTEAKQSQAT